MDKSSTEFEKSLNKKNDLHMKDMYELTKNYCEENEISLKEHATILGNLSSTIFEYILKSNDIPHGHIKKFFDDFLYTVCQEIKKNKL